MRTRFAPSPTGLLHLGHAYAATFASQKAQKHGGECLLRFEDIDSTRVRDEYYQQAIEDLAFLELEFPAPHLLQSTQSKHYAVALEQLIAENYVYPCFCSRKQIQTELSMITNAPHGPEGSHYPKTCFKISREEANERIADGQTPSWRLNSALAAKNLTNLYFFDTIHGKIKVDPTLLGDTILARKDIGTSYHLAVVYDDEFQCITDVTRGEDLLYSTHIHRILQELLGYKTPIYHHHTLVLDSQKKRLSKRHDSLSIKQLRQEGKSANEILNSLPIIAF